MSDWKTIESFDDYEISTSGQVRRLTQVRGTVAGQLIRWHKASTGYPNVRLRRGGKTYTKNVHSLMAEVFLGPRQYGNQVRHLDGNKTNCHVENLAYGTAKQNNMDKIRHGTTSAGALNPKAKMTIGAVSDIRDCRSKGESAKDIAKRVGLHPSTVHRIVAGVYWKEASNRNQDRVMR